MTLYTCSRWELFNRVIVLNSLRRRLKLAFGIYTYTCPSLKPDTQLRTTGVKRLNNLHLLNGFDLTSLSSLLYSPAEQHGVISTQRPQEFVLSVAVYWGNWAEVINDTGSSLVVLQKIYAIVIRPKYMALSNALGMRIKQRVQLLSHSWHDSCRAVSHYSLYPHVSLCRCWSGHSCYLLRFLHVL